MEPLFFKTPSDLKKWFAKNHDKLSEAWIGYYKKASKLESITWDESVEEALCVGWIDGLRKSIDDKSYKIRFTPRRPNSNWSLKNIKSMKILIDSGRMQAAGMAIYQKRKEDKTGIYAFEQTPVTLAHAYERQLKANKKAATFFYAQAPSYQKTATHWVMRAKQEKTRLKRLNDLITDSENQLRVKPFRRPEKK